MISAELRLLSVQDYHQISTAKSRPCPSASPLLPLTQAKEQDLGELSLVKVVVG